MRWNWEDHGGHRRGLMWLGHKEARHGEPGGLKVSEINAAWATRHAQSRPSAKPVNLPPSCETQSLPRHIARDVLDQVGHAIGPGLVSSAYPALAG